MRSLSRFRVRAVAFVVAVAALVSLPAIGAMAQCNVAGQWRQSTDNTGTSDWHLTAQGDNSYSAREQGLGNAVGTAIVSGNVLRIEWRTPHGSGVYQWQLDGSCRAGQGQLQFYTGRSGTWASNVQRVGQAPAADGGRGYWARWVSGSWSSAWAYYHEGYIASYGQPVCGHGTACNCAGRNFCGAYPSGSQAPTWPQGCNRPVIQVRCETRMGSPDAPPSGAAGGVQHNAACVQNCTSQHRRCMAPGQAWAAECNQQYQACVSRC